MAIGTVWQHRNSGRAGKRRLALALTKVYELLEITSIYGLFLRGRYHNYLYLPSLFGISQEDVRVRASF